MPQAISKQKIYKQAFHETQNDHSVPQQARKNLGFGTGLKGYPKDRPWFCGS